jgi:hypothetical protein
MFDFREYDPKCERLARIDMIDCGVDRLPPNRPQELRGDRRSVEFIDATVRGSEYAAYNRVAGAPLGPEITWIEGSARYTHVVPDIPVNFGGKNISLRQVPGMVVYRSIESLQLNQTDEHAFTVSVVTPETANVRAVNFARGSFAWCDIDGYPMADMPVTFSDAYLARVRLGQMMDDYRFMEGANGWHGSLACGPYREIRYKRVVSADTLWATTLQAAVITKNIVDLAIGDTKNTRSLEMYGTAGSPFGIISLPHGVALIRETILRDCIIVVTNS